MRPQHQGPRDRKHLLLAARQRAGLLLGAFRKPREIGVRPREILRDRAAIAPRIGAERQIFLDCEVDERAAPVRHMRDAEAHDIFGLPGFDATAFEQDCPGVAHLHVADRTQQRGLAGAIGAKQRGDAAWSHDEIEPMDHRRLPIGDAKPAQFKQSGHAAVPR